MSEQTIEELMRSCNRARLGKMAEALGLSSADYPSKRSIAEAILKTRAEQPEGERIEKERGGHVQELKKKMTGDTVKGKIAAIKALVNENQAFAKEMQAGIKEMQAGIKEQVNENQAFAKDFYG